MCQVQFSNSCCLGRAEELTRERWLPRRLAHAREASGVARLSPGDLPLQGRRLEERGEHACLEMGNVVLKEEVSEAGDDLQKKERVLRKKLWGTFCLVLILGIHKQIHFFS